MTSVIEAPVEYDPIEIINAPDFSVESEIRYENEIDGAVPEWFRPEVAREFGGLNTWFETPADTARAAYEVIHKITAGQDRLWGETFRNKAAQVLASPEVRSYIFGKYLGRLQRANDGRQKLMHDLMYRNIVVLRNRLNETRAHLARFSHNVVNRMDRLIAHERTQRVANDANVIRIAVALRDQAIRTAKQWTIDTVYLPLAHEITHTHAIITTETRHAIAVDHQATLEELVRVIAPIATAAYAANKIAQNLQTVNDTCVQPMCATHGPNTPLGKLFNALKGVEWLAILAALEVMDVKTLEHLAARLAGVEGDIGSWVATHILDELEAEHG